MWMGGMPPLGYDVKDRKLVVNKNEARTYGGDRSCAQKAWLSAD